MPTAALLDAEAIKTNLAHPPIVSGDLPGLGGAIKSSPETFQVEEILPYAPRGEGEHVFITLRRSGWNTVDVARRLADHLDLKTRQVGWAGRKDRQAVATQTFSLHLGLRAELGDLARRLSELPFEVLSINRHVNKLKTGHVAGNRFKILLADCTPGALDRAGAVAGLLARQGIPNFYGEQRFGLDMRNIDGCLKLLQRTARGRGRRDDFSVSVLQAVMFNEWLSGRMRVGDYRRIISGDVARKTATGGLFIADDATAAQERFAQGEIIYTGPIFGFKMMAAAAAAGDREAAVLARFGLSPADFRPLKAPGSRRPALLYLKDLSILPSAEGLWFAFTLPKGAYATVVMREFIHPRDRQAIQDNGAPAELPMEPLP
jgi:tRNA pseudouridine13 synthase